MLAVAHKTVTLACMGRFIEFSTSSKSQEYFAEFSFGNPLHDGNLPSRLADSAIVRVDGEPVQFTDETMHERLHKALRVMKKRQYLGFNCRRFAAVMYDPNIIDPLPAYFLLPDYESPVADDDPTVTKPVALGTIGDNSPLSDSPFYNRHMAIPAHQPEQAAYLHKLGYEGPICISGLRAAMDMYECTHAFLPSGFATGELQR